MVSSKLGNCFLAVILSALPAETSEWDKLVDDHIEGYRAIKDRKPVAFPEMGERLHTLFRSHSLSHVQIFIQRGNAKRELGADLYYGKGELHIVQHIAGWNLVTKGDEAFEWRFGARTGDNSPTEVKELFAYTVYLTDPAYFPTYLFEKYLSEPESFEPPVPGSPGLTKLRVKEPMHGFTEIQVDLKHVWYGEFEFIGKAGVPTRWIFSKPKAIEKVPVEVFDRMKKIRFWKGTKKLSRHRTYL
jgi:hypothetical protein